MMLQRGLHHKEVCRSLTCQGLLASIPEAQMLARQLPTHPTARRGRGSYKRSTGRCRRSKRNKSCENAPTAELHKTKNSCDKRGAVS